MSYDKDLDEVTKAFEEMRSQPSCFSKQSVPDFVTPELDFDVDPKHFMKWLEAEEYEVTGIYRQDCASMCEFSCLYLSMLLYDNDLEGELKVISGKYGWWEHYWMMYTLDDVTYYLDLTLMQFVSVAPKFSICLEVEDAHGYNNEWCDGIDYRKYVDDKMGFDFYTNPEEIV